jgi:hypothetical protein
VKKTWVSRVEVEVFACYGWRLSAMSNCKVWGCEELM